MATDVNTSACDWVPEESPCKTSRAQTGLVLLCWPRSSGVASELGAIRDVREHETVPGSRGLSTWSPVFFFFFLGIQS